MVTIVVMRTGVSINWEDKGVSKAIICQPNEVKWEFTDEARIDVDRIAHSEVFRILYDWHVARGR